MAAIPQPPVSHADPTQVLLSDPAVQGEPQLMNDSELQAAEALWNDPELWRMLDLDSYSLLPEPIDISDSGLDMVFTGDGHLPVPPQAAVLHSEAEPQPPATTDAATYLVSPAPVAAVDLEIAFDFASQFDTFEDALLPQENAETKDVSQLAAEVIAPLASAQADEQVASSPPPLPSRRTIPPGPIDLLKAVAPISYLDGGNAGEHSTMIFVEFPCSNSC